LKANSYKSKSVMEKLIGKIIYQPIQRGSIYTESVYFKIYKSKRASDVFVIFSYGNNSSAANMESWAYGFVQKFKCNVVLYDYPGYGSSEGNPSEKGCCYNLAFVVNELHAKYPKMYPILMGHSLGTSVVIAYLHYMQKLGFEWQYPIILIAPFRSIQSVVHLDFIGLECFNTQNRISSLECPIKIIHGTRDTIIPVEHSLYLCKKIKNPLVPTYYPTGHNEILDYIIRK
jgi:pimeloyl-ACP methyl ester carboxylesterase